MIDMAVAALDGEVTVEVVSKYLRVIRKNEFLKDKVEKDISHFFRLMLRAEPNSTEDMLARA